MSSNPPNLPFQSMCVALERAKQVAGSDDGPWTVGVRNDRGELLASAMLESHAQVKAFTAAMEDLGFVHSVLEAQEAGCSCDYSFRLRRDAPQPAGDLLHA
jgi:hypothetical protein